MKFHQAMKQTRQGRTFEVKAPSWYAENGLEYERRRLAAASIAPTAKGPTPGPSAAERGTAQNTPEKSARGFLGRLFGRAVGQGPEAIPPPSGPETTPAAKRGGCYQNFENYRNGASPAETKSPAEAKIAAHFALTHREPEKAAASFQAMLREAPRLALWAAAKHPQAFGEPTGRDGPGIAWREIRPLVAATPREPAPRPVARDPHSQEAALTGERLELREAVARARAKAAPEKAQLSMVRSLARLADRIERETPTDPESKERATHIRGLARDLNRGDAVTPPQRRDQAERIHGAAAQKDKSALYRELEDQLRQRDQARVERRARERDDGGRGAAPVRTTAPGGAENSPTTPSKRGGYFENFENYRSGGRPAEERAPADAAPGQQRGKWAPEKPERSIAESLGRLANRIERQAPADPAAKEQANHIRVVARDLDRGDAATQAARRDQAERIHGAAEQKDKAALYRELEAQLRERDQAPAKHRTRHRDDSRRER
jgi:hypothetical protein